MNKYKIYLDICTYNRPFDVQSQIKVRLETEAKLFIQAGIKSCVYSMVWSFMHDYENTASPYEEQRKSIGIWEDFAIELCPSSGDIHSLANDLAKLGLKPKDALHIACAVKSDCDYFITTDKKLLNKTVEGIKIVNPIDFIDETEGLT